MQDAFQRDEVRVVVATVAFGLGIDKSNVRFVVHFDMPKSIESYYQETGRAGRDGLPADALLLYGLGDVATARALIESGSTGDQLRIDLHKLNAMVGFAEAVTCRRRALLGYFGETPDADCGNCDVCLDPPELYDGTEDAQKALSCVYRLGAAVRPGARRRRAAGRRHRAHPHPGPRSPLDVRLRRAPEPRGVDEPPAPADPQGLPAPGHRAVLGAEADRGRRARVLRGDEHVQLARPRVFVAAPAERRPRARGRSSGGRGSERRERAPPSTRWRPPGSSVSGPCVGNWPTSTACPAYVIFSDATLWEMAGVVPRDEAELLQVNGVGQTKLERYGARFLEALVDD